MDNSEAVFAYEKGYLRRCRYLNTAIMVILTLSRALGVNDVVTDVPRRSDWVSEVADDRSKGNTSTIRGHNFRKLVSPESILEWIRCPSKDDFGLGYQIMSELKSNGIIGLVPPYRPKFVEPQYMDV